MGHPKRHSSLLAIVLCLVLNTKVSSSSDTLFKHLWKVFGYLRIVLGVGIIFGRKLIKQLAEDVPWPTLEELISYAETQPVADLFTFD